MRHGGAYLDRDILRSNQLASERMTRFVATSSMTRQSLSIVVQVLESLLAERAFTQLLSEEGLDSFPKTIAERMNRT